MPLGPITQKVGTAGTKDVGTAANNVVQLTAAAKLPAVDGSLLTNVSASVADGITLKDAAHNPVFDTTSRMLLAPDGETQWIDLSGSVGDGTKPYFGHGLYYADAIIAGDGSISIGDNSGSAASIDGSGNLIATTISDTNGNTLASLFDGSGGHVLLADLANSANAAGTGFDTFFAGAGQSSSGSSDVFLQTNGDGSSLTGFAKFTVGTGWTANESAGDKTQAIANYSGSGLNGTMVAALNVVSAGTGTALAQDEARTQELIKKVQAIEAALVALTLPNA